MVRGEWVKIVADIAGVGVSAVAGVWAATDSTPLTVTAIGAVLVFAGLLVRQVMQGQSAVWEIVAEKDKTIERLKDDNDRLEHTVASLRFRLGERDDPGPFIPRKATT